MSYDLFLVRGDTSAEILDAVEHSFGDEAEEPNSGDPSEAAEAAKRSLAERLKTCDVALAEFEFDHALIARELRISGAEACRQWRHIELNSPEGGPGIQIELYEDCASLALPLWHAGSAAEKVWTQVWECLGILEREGHYRVFDPQLDRTLDLDQDFPTVIASYRGITG